MGVQVPPFAPNYLLELLELGKLQGRRNLYHAIYESKGFWFRTPEAWDITGNFRASTYMRPVGILAMEMTPPVPQEKSYSTR
jgi:Glycosyl-hydrolase family 116, catalytic region